MASVEKFDWSIPASSFQHERRHLPRTARPHIAWTREEFTNCKCTGDSRDDDQTKSFDANDNVQNREEHCYYENVCDKLSTNHKQECEGDEKCKFMENHDQNINKLVLTQLLTVDGDDATSLVLYGQRQCMTTWNVSLQESHICYVNNSNEEESLTNSNNHYVKNGRLVNTWQSSQIPSNRKITQVLSLNGSCCTNNFSCSEELLELLFAVSDDVGNIYYLSGKECETINNNDDERTEHVQIKSKNPRLEETSCVSTLPLSPTLTSCWSNIATSQSILPCYHVNETTPTKEEHTFFDVSYGAPGWSGLATVRSESNNSLLINAREFFSDVRVINPSTEQIVHVYSTTHFPTSLHSLSTSLSKLESNGFFAHCVLVTEGTLATLFDIRCQSSVLSLRDVHQVTEDYAQVNAHTSERKKYNKLVPGRLTSVNGLISDVCGTQNVFEVALSIDRALCVYDYRKFSRQFTSSSVLKYEIASIASCANGRSVVCAGIDAEVHTISLNFHNREPITHSNHNNKEQQKSKLHVRSNTADDNSTTQTSAQYHVNVTPEEQHTQHSHLGKHHDSILEPNNIENNIVLDNVCNDHVKSSFRTRLNSSAYCERTWHGGWVTALTNNGSAAVGVSSTGEIFMISEVK